MNRWGWNFFWSLAALNLFALAGYQWSHASEEKFENYGLVDAFEARVPLTSQERELLEDLEKRVLNKRQELLPEMEQMAPRVRALLLGDQFDSAELMQIFQQNFPRRLEYLQFEHEQLFKTLQQLPPDKREPVVDFLVEHRLRALRRWVNQSDR
jgi:hypothetical protein